MAVLKATSSVAEVSIALPTVIDAEDELDDLLDLLDKLKPQSTPLPDERPDDFGDLLQLRAVLKPHEQFLV